MNNLITALTQADATFVNVFQQILRYAAPVIAALLLFRMVQLANVSYIAEIYAGLVLVDIIAGVSLSLAVFNLLPIPPLDGSRIFAAVLPSRWTFYMNQYQQYFTIGVMFLIATGALNRPLAFLVHYLGGILCAIVGLPNYF